MNKRKYNSGELDVSNKNSRTTVFMTSAYESNNEFLKILIIVSILLLAVVATIFFIYSNDDISSLGQQIQQGGEPNTPAGEDFPYATVPTMQNYISDGNGTGLGGVNIASEYAILIDLSTMETVASKNADARIYPASMTKVMTVLVACDLINDLDDNYVISRRVLNQVPSGASTAYLSDYVGRTVTVKDLLYGISYRSGADAVLCLLDYLGLSVDEFATLMNKKAAEIGLTNTRFGGAIGMDEEVNQTTCREIAAIMAYAMDNPLCREVFGGERYVPTYITELSYYHGTLVTTVSGSMGMSPGTLVKGYTVLAAKSGFETLAEHCLVSYIQNDQTGKCFVLVTAYADGSKTLPISDLVTIISTIKP